MRHARDAAYPGRQADLTWFYNESLGELVHGLPIGKLATPPLEQFLAIGRGRSPRANEARIDRGGEAGAQRARRREPGDKGKNDWRKRKPS